MGGFIPMRLAVLPGQGSSARPTGSGEATQVTVWTGASTLGGYSSFTYDGTNTLTVPRVSAGGAVSASTLVHARSDQAAATQINVTNNTDNASSSARLNLASSAGTLGFLATSTAQGANAYIDASSGFTGGLQLTTNTAAASVKLAPNGAVALTVGLSSSNRSLFAGHLGVGSDPSTDTALRVRTTDLTSTNQFGIYCDTVFQSEATSSGQTITAQFQTANSSFTMGHGRAFYITTASKGAASTVTRYSDINTVLSTPGTNNAVFSDNSSFTGDWIFNFTSTRPSSIGGSIQVINGGTAVNTFVNPTAAPFIIKSLTGNSNGLRLYSDTATDVASVINGYNANLELGANSTVYQTISGAGLITWGTGTSTTHRLNITVQTTVGAAGGASALPATPTGYVLININGTNRAIPYYAAS